MSKNLFFASAAKAAFALAAVVMMSTVFTSCSKDSDEPEPEPKFTNTVTFGGVEKPIVKAEYEDKGSGNYNLYLYLSADLKKRVAMQLNKDVHMTGSPVKLTEKEKKHDGKWYWVVDYYTADGTLLINTFGKSDDTQYPVFTTGTLTISGSPESTLNIKLENGRVKDINGNEHSLAMSYSGPMTKKK